MNSELITSVKPLIYPGDDLKSTLKNPLGDVYYRTGDIITLLVAIGIYAKGNKNILNAQWNNGTVKIRSLFVQGLAFPDLQLQCGPEASSVTYDNRLRITRTGDRLDYEECQGNVFIPLHDGRADVFSEELTARRDQIIGGINNTSNLRKQLNVSVPADLKWFTNRLKQIIRRR